MTKEEEQVFLDLFKTVKNKKVKDAKRMHELFIKAEAEIKQLRKQLIEKRIAERAARRG